MTEYQTNTTCLSPSFFTECSHDPDHNDAVNLSQCVSIRKGGLGNTNTLWIETVKGRVYWDFPDRASRDAEYGRLVGRVS